MQLLKKAQLLIVVIIVCVSQEAMSQNSSLYLEYDYLFKTQADELKGPASITGTHNKSYRIGYFRSFQLDDQFSWKIGLSGGVTFINDIYIFEQQVKDLPDGFPSDWSEREYLFEAELVDIGIPFVLSYSQNLNENISLAPQVGARMFTPVLAQDYTQGDFVLSIGRAILIDRNYQNNGRDGYSLFTTPRLSYHIGLGSEIVVPKLSSNAFLLNVILVRGPQNLENSTFEALTFDDDLETTGTLNINRNHLGLQLGFSY